MTTSINIRPGVSVLSVLPHLNYKPWFALAEFVDNSLQSYLYDRIALQEADGDDYQLHVDIEINAASNEIIIRDNAAGIRNEDYPRAFRPAELPPERSSLSEFGMGMKSAACWFSPTWTVRTSALGESIERRVSFDIVNIVQDQIEELVVEEIPIDEDLHFTEIKLSQISRTPARRTLGKIVEHLKDIYRVFSSRGDIVLRLNGEPLIYDAPEILVAPHHKKPNSEPIQWKKKLEFDFGEGLRAHGFAAIRKKASVSKAGFALFRRDRLIQGSGDEGYRPEQLFGKSNSFIYQRLFGELHLEGFDVSHTKDGFKWDENEEPFLDILKDELSSKEMPLLQQAREHRVQATRRQLVTSANKATKRVADTIQDHVPPVMEELATEHQTNPVERELSTASAASTRVIEIDFLSQRWRITIELSDDPAVGDWLSLSDSILRDVGAEDTEGIRQIGMRLALRHPFMERFAGADADQIEAVLRLGAALGLAETAARESGVRFAGTIRANVNELLRTAMWRT